MTETETETKTTMASNLIFPWKLHELLETVERRNQDDIISWTPDGKSFKIQKERFAKEIMAEYFGSTKYKSFQRSLNLWGYKCVPSALNKKGDDNIAQYYHPCFVRAAPDMCLDMKRVRVRGTGKKRSSPSTSTSNARMNSPRASDTKKKASSTAGTTVSPTINGDVNRGVTAARSSTTHFGVDNHLAGVNESAPGGDHHRTGADLLLLEMMLWKMITESCYRDPMSPLHQHRPDSGTFISRSGVNHRIGNNLLSLSAASATASPLGQVLPGATESMKLLLALQIVNQSMLHSACHGHTNNH